MGTIASLHHYAPVVLAHTKLAGRVVANMATAAKTDSINGLVDTRAGIISREIFVNEEIYQQEQEQIFARSWLLVGHESQVPKPGDYFVSCMG